MLESRADNSTSCDPVDMSEIVEGSTDMLCSEGLEQVLMSCVSRDGAQ